jgi:hypothetical protein
MDLVHIANTCPGLAAFNRLDPGSGVHQGARSRSIIHEITDTGVHPVRKV